jgi:porphobilinogen synthase
LLEKEEEETRSTANASMRMRRLRGTPVIREMVQESRVHPSSLMMPIFVRYGQGVIEPVAAMPGINRYSIDRLSRHVEDLVSRGIRSVLLFGIPESKDEAGTGGYSSDGIIPSAVRELRNSFPSLVIAADVCLCEYTSHGHCGIVEKGVVKNDETLPLLATAAVEYAKAGADLLCPSAMMDGQVSALRRALDDAGYQERLVMGYSAKFASSFYGPFRQAAGSTPAFGDRRGYQMNPANAREALREIESDVREGADIIMVKPALSYLDVIARARARFDLPIAAYNVSGEYAMIRAAGLNGWLDEKRTILEVLTSIRRAGADIIITYFAPQAMDWLRAEW